MSKMSDFGWILGERAYFTVEELWNKAMEDDKEAVLEAMETAESIKDAIEEGWFDAAAVDKEYKSPVYSSFLEEISAIAEEAGKRLEELEGKGGKE